MLNVHPNGKGNAANAEGRFASSRLFKMYLAYLTIAAIFAAAIFASGAHDALRPMAVELEDDFLKARHLTLQDANNTQCTVGSASFANCGNGE